jgi:hypothetical protein
MHHEIYFHMIYTYIVLYLLAKKLWTWLNFTLFDFGHELYSFSETNYHCLHLGPLHATLSSLLTQLTYDVMTNYFGVRFFDRYCIQQWHTFF